MRQRSAKNGAFTNPTLIIGESEGNKCTHDTPAVRPMSCHGRGRVRRARTARECPEPKQPEELCALMVNSISPVSNTYIVNEQEGIVSYGYKHVEQLCYFMPREVRGGRLKMLTTIAG